MKTQNTTTGAGGISAAQFLAVPNQAARPSDKRIYRASIDGKVVGHFISMSAAMKVLTARAVKDARGCSGYVDVYDPDDTIMPMKGPEEDDYKCVRHRVVDGGRGNSGWFWND